MKKQKKINTTKNLALLGNPNVGKSTLFNELTGLKQKTGNWPGKTVEHAKGTFTYKQKKYEVIDLPGTYSLEGYLEEEKVTANYLQNNKIDITIIIIDATAIERNLTLVLSTISKIDNIIICVNLIDEAKKNNIIINYKKLQELLKVPVIKISARKKIGIRDLLEEIENFKPNHKRNDIKNIDKEANNIYKQTVKEETYNKKTLKIDKIVTSKKYGILIMLLTLGIILWITIIGANYISDHLNYILFKLLNIIENTLNILNINKTIIDIIINGILKTVFWVISVMLPPMAIFFPLFSLLEDSGYLPRIAFNLDKTFKKCGTQGKQALTMCMGYGCNACGVIGCRIIKDKKEKLIAMITNCFSPCNGRFPTIIAMISIFITINIKNKLINTTLSALILLGFILLSILITFLVSKILSKTILKTKKSTFTLELPPYRKPQIIKTIINSIKDKIIFVLARAIYVSIPAGLIIWILSNTNIQGTSLLLSISNTLDPFGQLLGLDGVIILALILGLPANEIVIPIIIMTYLAKNNITGYNSLQELRNLLINNNWTLTTALSFILITIFHFPCATTILTIKKETKSLKWTILSILIPTIIGIIICLLFSNIIKLFI